MSEKTNKTPNARPIFHFFPKSTKHVPIGASEFYKENLPEPTKENKDEQKVNENLLLENQKLKLQLNEANTKIEQLIKENKKCQNDLVSLKKLYNATCRSYVQKDFKIKLLEKNVSKGNETNVEKDLMYEQHNGIFDEQTLIKLRSVNGAKRSDSSFVLICMRKLYENSLSTLHLKSACGTHKGKTVISPEKRRIIESLLLERLSSEATSDEDANLRYLRLNDLINNAINNICRTVTTLLNVTGSFYYILPCFNCFWYFYLKANNKTKNSNSNSTNNINCTSSKFDIKYINLVNYRLMNFNNKICIERDSNTVTVVVVIFCCLFS